MDKKEYAISLHDRGCNCAQSVVCSFAKECGANEEILMKISEGLGRGFGGMQGVCGALSGAVMVAGFKYADGNIEAPKTKLTTYDVADRMCKEFKARCGSLICAEIKGINDGKPLISCPECIKIGVEITENMLGGKYDNN